jgi:hypothetical protein
MSYFVLCMFCGESQRSEYWDEVEEHIMECREKASPEKRGELAVSDMETSPIRCETEMQANATQRIPEVQEQVA